MSSDCNDQNATVYPSAPEQCDGIDNNCDGDVDVNTSHGTSIMTAMGSATPDFSNDCDPGTGYVDNDLDCDE